MFGSQKRWKEKRTRETHPWGRVSRVWQVEEVGDAEQEKHVQMGAFLVCGWQVGSYMEGERERTCHVACPFAFCSKMGKYTKNTPFGVFLVPTTTRRDEHARTGVFIAVWSLSKDKGEGKRERTRHMACSFAFGCQMYQVLPNATNAPKWARSSCLAVMEGGGRHKHERTRHMACSLCLLTGKGSCSFVGGCRERPDTTKAPKRALSWCLACLFVLKKDGEGRTLPVVCHVTSVNKTKKKEKKAAHLCARCSPPRSCQKTVWEGSPLPVRVEKRRGGLKPPAFSGRKWRGGAQPSLFSATSRR